MLKSVWILFFAIILCSFSATAQISLRGIVKDLNGKVVDGATVGIYVVGTKDTIKTLCNDRGIFNFKDVPSVKIGVVVSRVGYDAFGRIYDYSAASGEQVVSDIVLNPGSKMLENVTIQAAKIMIKEDTVSFRIDSTMYRKNDNVEEVLKKLPGVEVDNKTGAVTAQGQQVTKVKVNGKDFFGGDVATATRNLNADMVDRIDIVDDYGDQAAFTGVRTGDATKTMNIQLKKDKNKGWFGNASLGGGTEDRYANNITLNRFNNQRQITLLGNLNNTNASTFNFGGFGAGMGGLIRSVGAGMGGGNSGNGIATTKSLGLNFKDEWNAKLSVYGSYSFTNKATTTISEVNTLTNFTGTDTAWLKKQGSDDLTKNNNHRMSLNMEYRIDSANYLKFSPSVNFGETNSWYRSSFNQNEQKGADTATKHLRNAGLITDDNRSRTPNFSGNLLYNRRLDRRGRVISLNLTGSTTESNSEETYYNQSQYYFLSFVRDSLINQQASQSNNNYNYGANISYIEPFDKKRSLEFNYSHNRQHTGNDKETDDIRYVPVSKIDSLSTIYSNDYYTNRFGINFRNNQKKYTYSIGMAVQPAIMESKSTGQLKYAYRQTLINYYPVVRFTYNFTRSRSFSLNYSGNTRQPSFSQLQPIADVSSQQNNIIIGNPDLRPEFANTINARYNNFDFVTGNVFFGNISFTLTNDKIVTNVIRRKNMLTLTQETRYLNADGAYNATAFYNFMKPIMNRKFVFSYGGMLTYNNNLAFIDSVKTYNKNSFINQRFTTTISLKKWFETTVGVVYGLNYSKYNNQKNTINNWTLTHNTRLDLKHDWTVTYSLDKTFNDGYASNIAANPFIINAGLEKLISKKYNASLKLNGYDLLNQNVSINRTVSNNTITDSRVNKLGRYALLSLVFRFSKFVGEAPPQRTMVVGQ